MIIILKPPSTECFVFCNPETSVPGGGNQHMPLENQEQKCAQPLNDGCTLKQGTKASEPSVSTSNAEVQRLLAKRISDLEGLIQGSEPRVREIAKRHKKSLREVQRIVADKCASMKYALFPQYTY